MTKKLPPWIKITRAAARLKGISDPSEDVRRVDGPSFREDPTYGHMPFHALYCEHCGCVIHAELAKPHVDRCKKLTRVIS